jgi:type I restriction-modification system DNA methylase subunit
MAKTTKQKGNTTAPYKNKFAESLFKIGHRFSLGKVFDDFLTMSIAACTQNPETKLSYYEDEYLATIAPYKDSELRHEFPTAFANLIMEMEERTGSSLGNDVMGDFFEQNISSGRNGQFFTPYPICQFMASITHTDSVIDDIEGKRPLRILDPTCGSGRMLLSSHKTIGAGYEYYGIDIDRTCVKMAALNLFLNGIWNSEVMCANSLSPDDFVISYHISFIPLGIFKIEEKEKSRLWQLRRNSFTKPEKKNVGSFIELDTTPFSERSKDNSVQLGLF